MLGFRRYFGNTALRNAPLHVFSKNGFVSRSMVDQQPEFEKYRSYLLCIARSVSGAGGDVAIDPEDAVHQTILRACQNHSQYRGETDAQLAAWLREIMWNYVRDTYRRSNR